MMLSVIDECGLVLQLTLHGQTTECFLVRYLLPFRCGLQNRGSSNPFDFPCSFLPNTTSLKIQTSVGILFNGPVQPPF